MLAKIRRPPSDRVWVGFYQPPTLVLAVEPLVGRTSIKMPFVLQALEKFIREALDDVVVLPNMDDYVIGVVPDEIFGRAEQAKAFPPPSPPGSTRGSLESINHPINLSDAEDTTHLSKEALAVLANGPGTSAASAPTSPSTSSFGSTSRDRSRPIEERFPIL